MEDIRIKYSGGIKSLLENKEDLLPYWNNKIETVLHNDDVIKLDPSIITVGDLYNYYYKRYYTK